MRPEENAETVDMPHSIHRRAPIQCFLVLVVVNLMWAFQFSGAKIATARLGPIAVAFIPRAFSTVLFVPLVLISRARSPSHGGLPWFGGTFSSLRRLALFQRSSASPGVWRIRGPVHSFRLFRPGMQPREKALAKQQLIG